MGVQPSAGYPACSGARCGVPRVRLDPADWVPRPSAGRPARDLSAQPGRNGFPRRSVMVGQREYLVGDCPRRRLLSAGARLLRWRRPRGWVSSAWPGPALRTSDPAQTELFAALAAVPRPRGIFLALQDDDAAPPPCEECDGG
ncbi:MAG: hypothetical protein MZU79_08935 [Anaerotruncus sp.]|nr:hypothetical protein [Anaerotruncus sp.]